MNPFKIVIIVQTCKKAGAMGSAELNFFSFDYLPNLSGFPPNYELYVQNTTNIENIMLKQYILWIYHGHIIEIP